MEFFFLCDVIAVQDAKAAMEETLSLQTQIHQAEAAQKQAQGMEPDYEEVIHLLEAEISEMKSQLADKPSQFKVSVGWSACHSLPPPLLTKNPPLVF